MTFSKIFDIASWIKHETCKANHRKLMLNKCTPLINYNETNCKEMNQKTKEPHLHKLVVTNKLILQQRQHLLKVNKPPQHKTLN